MRLYIDLPDDIVEKARALALQEDRDPKQQIEHLAKRAIAKAFHAHPAAAEAFENMEVADAPARVE